MASANTVQLLIGADGTLSLIHDDELTGLVDGKVTITRASHVEPTVGGEWTADMSPVGGPVLGPFPKRGLALDAERVWLNANTL